MNPTPEGGWEVQETQEWDVTETNLMLALAEVERQTCNGCGGDLTVELTNKPPAEDDGDGHFHRFHTLWCRGCVAHARLNARRRKEDEALSGTEFDNYPQARIDIATRLPIP